MNVGAVQLTLRTVRSRPEPSGGGPETVLNHTMPPPSLAACGRSASLRARYPLSR
jgi:hypothetical protein